MRSSNSPPLRFRTQARGNTCLTPLPSPPLPLSLSCGARLQLNREKYSARLFPLSTSSPFFTPTPGAFYSSGSILPRSRASFGRRYKNIICVAGAGSSILKVINCPGLCLGTYHQVIDCGGGTVDISAFMVVNAATSSLDQLGKAVGGPWGSTNVDKQFETYLKVSWRDYRRCRGVITHGTSLGKLNH